MSNTHGVEQRVKQLQTGSVAVKGEHYASMELLHSRKVTSRHKELFAASSTPHNGSPHTQSQSPLAQSPQSLAQSLAQSPLSLASLSVHSPHSSTEHTATALDNDEKDEKDPKDLIDEKHSKDPLSPLHSRPDFSLPRHRLLKADHSVPDSLSLSSPSLTHSPLPNTAVAPSPQDSPSKVFVSTRKSPNNSPTSDVSSPVDKNLKFKDWYQLFVSTAVEDVDGEFMFADVITLDELFGSKKNCVDSVKRILWTAKAYDKIKDTPEWLFRDETIPSPTKSVESPTSDNEDVEIIHYRVLDIFQDGNLDSVTYSDTNSISAGTPQSLIDALIFPLGQSMEYSESFLATYRFFMSPHHLLNSLTEWYNVDVDAESCTPAQDAFLRKHRRYIQNRVTKVMLMWIKNHWSDLNTRVDSFVKMVGQVSFGEFQKLIQGVREQRLAWYTNQYIPPHAPELEGEIPDELVVKELIDLEQFYVGRVVPDTYLQIMSGNAKRKGGRYNQAIKMVVEYCCFFSLVNKYIVTCVEREDGSRKKAKAVKRVLKIAKECRISKSYNCVFAIVSALKSQQIASLATMWEYVPPKYLDYFKDLCTLVDPTSGYSHFWTEFRSAVPPATPFLGAYIHDILEIHDEVPLYLGSNTEEEEELVKKIVNFRKMRDLWEIIKELEGFRSSKGNCGGFYLRMVREIEEWSQEKRKEKEEQQDGKDHEEKEDVVKEEVEGVSVSVKSMKRLSGFLMKGR